MSFIYKALVRVADPMVPARFRGLWEHPAGPKTVHFWAPAFKWSLVFAGIADINRPADKLSIKQSGALAATGSIWSRYSLVIIPKNMSLFLVNVFVAGTGYFQLGKIIMHHQENPDAPW